jgi:hypothetical protein
VTDPCGQLAGPPQTYSHVVVIMEENLSYQDAIGNTDAPYLNMLASDCALATNFHNETHPSQPNYMAATSGYATGVGVHSSSVRFTSRWRSGTTSRSRWAETAE